MYHHAAGWGAGAIVAVGFLWAARSRLERHWLGVFVVFAFASGFLAVMHISSLVLAQFRIDPRRLNSRLVDVYAGAIVCGALAILWALFRDRRLRAADDGFHRLGAAAWLAIAAIQLVMYLLYLAQ
jgi:hypothetical protein